MTDSRLVFVNTAGGLMPADSRAEEWRGKVKLGSLVVIDPPKQPRNVNHHRLYWALIDVVWQNIDQERYPTREDLHEAIKVSAGLRKRFELPDGTVGFIPGSIAFHKMSQPEFAAFYDRVCDIVAKYFLPGVTAEQLKRQVSEMIGIAA